MPPQLFFASMLRIWMAVWYWLPGNTLADLRFFTGFQKPTFLSVLILSTVINFGNTNSNSRQIQKHQLHKRTKSYRVEETHSTMELDKPSKPANMTVNNQVGSKYVFRQYNGIPYFYECVKIDLRKTGPRSCGPQSHLLLTYTNDNGI